MLEIKNKLIIFVILSSFFIIVTLIISVLSNNSYLSSSSYLINIYFANSHIPYNYKFRMISPIYVSNSKLINLIKSGDLVSTSTAEIKWFRSSVSNAGGMSRIKIQLHMKIHNDEYTP